MGYNPASDRPEQFLSRNDLPIEQFAVQMVAALFLNVVLRFGLVKQEGESEKGQFRNRGCSPYGTT
jgi:hypothetical protein